jgi:hypothetical protein
MRGASVRRAAENLRMHAKVSELLSAALLAMLLSCGTAYAESIPLIHAHGTLQVPVVINGKISLNFTIDSGATDVSIPATGFPRQADVQTSGRIRRNLAAISHSILASG